MTTATQEFLRKELSVWCQRAFNRGLVSGTGGNMSVRIPGTDTVLITPTGISLGDVLPEENLLLNLNGDLLESPKGLRGSKETGFHLAAFRARPDIGAVAHVHPPYATAFSAFGLPLSMATVSARGGLKHVPCVGCAPAGSPELCDFVTEGITHHPGINSLLMKEHGILTLGPDLKAVFHLADLVEDTAKIAFIASQWAKTGPTAG